jgi:hypothetical protein
MILLSVSDQVQLVAQTVGFVVVAIGAIWTIRTQRTSEWRSQAEAFRGENQTLNDKVSVLQTEMAGMPKLETVDAKLTGINHLLEGHLRNVAIADERNHEQLALLIRASEHQQREHKQLSDEHNDMIENLARLNQGLVALLARIEDTSS